MTRRRGREHPAWQLRQVPWRSDDEATWEHPPASRRASRAGCITAVVIPLAVLALLVAVSVALAAAGGGS